jgi:hypothetical protein
LRVYCLVQYLAVFSQNVKVINKSEQNLHQILFNFIHFGIEQIWFPLPPQISELQLENSILIFSNSNPKPKPLVFDIAVTYGHMSMILTKVIFVKKE